LKVAALLLVIAFAGACAKAEESAAQRTPKATVLSETMDAGKAFSNIDALLTEIVAKYKAGATDEAAELAAEAYLENYEHLEDDLKKKSPDVNEELEQLLGTELRAKIKDAVPASELETMAARARVLLARAKKALDSHR
jgi:prolyl-tRNA synthetase